MSFSLALSGLNAAATDLNSTANNIANASTNGFKNSRTEFAELFSVSPQGSGNTNGNGVRVASIAQQFAQAIRHHAPAALADTCWIAKIKHWILGGAEEHARMFCGKEAASPQVSAERLTAFSLRDEHDE